LAANAKQQVDSTYQRVEQMLRSAIGAPYYSDQGFILYCGDCCEFLSKLQGTDVLFDLIVTSPPYNIGKEYENCVSVEAYVDWCSRWMTQLHVVATRRGSFWLNVGYLEVSDKGLCIPIPYLIWDKSPFYMVQEVVWQYGAGVSAKTRFSPRNEKWLFYVKCPEDYTFNLDAIRDPNVKYPNQKKNGKFRCNPLGKNPGDVWEFPKVTTGVKRSSKERTGHPAQFPIAVVERIVKASSSHAGLVLDPFAGSCSTGVAAVALGRVFVGFEIKADYCKLAVDRYKAFRKLYEASQRKEACLF
jgi:adenine-specific DNA-methyltransferase